MTDLTKDWKDGKLPSGWYYVKFPDTEVEICGFYKLSVFRLCADTNEIKILAEVPDYTAWQNLWNTAEKIKQLEQIIEGQKQIIESQKQTNLSLIRRLEEKVTNVKEL